MKENKAANSNKNINNTVDTVRNSDIIKLDKKNNTMNNIDLNTITVAEAKALNVPMEDIFKYVMRNPVNSATTKKNEEFAANLEAKTAKKKPARVAKKKIQSNQTTSVRLSWRSVVGGITNMGRVFTGVKELLGTDAKTWNKMTDYTEACLIAGKEVFGESIPEDELVSRVNRQIYNLMYALDIAEKGEHVVLQDSVWHAYNNPILAAEEAGVISDETCARYTDFFDGLK